MYQDFTAYGVADAPSALAAGRPVFWTNPDLDPLAEFASAVAPERVAAARQRMQRFAPLLARVFEQFRDTDGAIESALLPAPKLQQALGLAPQQGRLWIKADHLLPVAGSVKARGGFHEVLEFAERLALDHGLLREGRDYSVLAEPAARSLFSGYRVAVGSTGNLGMAIGIMSAALGFEAIVHMSADAKAWKKERLRARGVRVVEHPGDYEQAVAAGRDEARGDARTHFVDDEHSLSLMLGYALAGQELKAQLQAAGIVVDSEHPLFVYLPCGVGGAPTGISVGLKQALGPHVHCFFAEPTQAPCFLLAMLQPQAALPGSIYDIGLANRTEADGLAVPRASELAVPLMRGLLSGAYTVQDESLFKLLAIAFDSQQLRMEPSATAGLAGPMVLTGSSAGQSWLQKMDLRRRLPQATHLAWTTGGLHLPESEFVSFHARGSQA